jgi:predicted dehydrogenase
MGVLGATSVVATDAVLPAMAASSEIRLATVASRDPAAAAGVAARFGAERSTGDYLDVLEDDEVEAVYIPLPNAMHREWTVRAAGAGKHVLCEKPLATTAAEGAAMVSACQAAGVVLMEAYMTPFHPRAAILDDVLTGGVLGGPRFARAAFGFPLDDVANHRWRPEMGGGALLDVGIYCLSPLMELGGGAPVKVTAREVTAASGVDASFSGWLEFANGLTATFACSFEVPELQHLDVIGTAATVSVEVPFAGGVGGTRINLHHRDGRVEEVPGPDGDPYRGMVDHFAAVVRGRGPLRRPPAQTLALLALLDRLRTAASAPPGLPRR